MAEVVSSENIQGVHVVTPDVYKDERGFFVETYRREWIPEGSREMIQANRRSPKRMRSRTPPTTPGRLLVRAIRNRSSCAARFKTGFADRRRHRRNRPGRDQVSRYLHTARCCPWVRHTYRCDHYLLVDSYYNPSDEPGVAWNDPEIAADWG